MNIVAQYGIRGDGARGIVTSVETAIRQGRLAAGTPLPTVRDVAHALRVSPTTVAAAYRTLRVRGLVHAQGRRGTRVSPRPPLPIRPVAPAPAHLRDLSLGNPDPALLPSLTRALARLPRRPGLYGEPANRPALLALAGRQLEREGLPHDSLAIVGGALDGIERVLQAHLRPGDLGLSRARAVGARALGLEVAGPRPAPGDPGRRPDDGRPRRGPAERRHRLGEPSPPGPRRDALVGFRDGSPARARGRYLRDAARR